LADEYLVHVRLAAGPFEIDADTPSAIRAGDLRGRPGLLRHLGDMFTRWQAADENVKQDSDAEKEDDVEKDTDREAKEE
jgi:hypothetical protein